jgi:hypothetical protein
LPHLYQVAFKRFVDDIAVEVVETTIIAELSSILSPIKVTYLSADAPMNKFMDVWIGLRMRRATRPLRVP